MSPKKIIRKKMGIKDIKSIVPENLNKIKVNPFNVIDNAKDKINNFYTNLKKQREKEKRRLEKKRYLDEKKELQNKKRKPEKKGLIK